MSAENEPATPGIGPRDALLLALKRWRLLAFAPLAVTLLSAIIYINMPTSFGAFAQVNVELELLEIASKRIRSNLDESTVLRFDPVSEFSVAISAYSDSEASALETVRAVVSAAPDPAPTVSPLTADQRLSLRALRQYRDYLARTREAEHPKSPSEQFLNEEIQLVDARLRRLELSDVPQEALPKIVTEPRSLALRIPPLRNVVVFAFLFTAFVAWGLVFTRERQRLHGLRANPGAQGRHG
jgi:hypothetical protein